MSEQEKDKQNQQTINEDYDDDEDNGNDVGVGPDDQQQQDTQKQQEVKQEHKQPEKQQQEKKQQDQQDKNNQQQPQKQQQQEEDQQQQQKEQENQEQQQQQQQQQQDSIPASQDNIDQHQEPDDKMCPRCAKNQKQIEDQNQMADVLQNQNENLSDQVQDLKKLLEDTLQKQKEKEKEKPKKQVDPEEKKLKGEIDDINVKFLDYKEKIQKFQKKMDTDQNYERALKIQNEQRILEQEIEKIKEQNKQIDRDRRDNEYAIQLRNAEFVQQKKELEDELKKQKKILTDLRNSNRDSKIEMLVQQEYLVRLEEQHREVCDTYGASFSMVQTRIDRMTDLIQQNHQRKLAQYEKEESKKQKFDITPENYRNFIKQIKELTQEKNRKIRENQQKLSDIQSKTQLSHREQELKKQKLKEKEHEVNIALIKINEMKRHLKHNQLQPLNIEPQHRYERHATTRSQQDFKILSKKLQVKQEPRTVIGGVLFSQDGEKINDDEKLPQDKEYRIGVITLHYIDDMILGMEVEYYVQGEENIKVEQFMPQNLNLASLQTKSLRLTTTEYIQSITGYYNKEQITYLEIITSRSRTLTVGSDKNYKKQRRFELDIKGDERPVAFNNIIDKANKAGGENLFDEKLLINIGLVCKKREVGAFQMANIFKKRVTNFKSQENLNKKKNNNNASANNNQSQENI